ncbi:helix-turn-helix domain-containing protein [Staphylococcus aureus]|uniref:helix-turn-helix domain-containing protein n=1 Tax=Staphylococcus aureus TaxID=1280 RepID=UPI0029C07412|nr:helix-turn-helix domain-containing protein [Staphylococcus aureus]WPF96927.1 helix-turn-helix domain-containing protein [Staphylococcus aureus]WPF98889.1 helix-turn-helix domain-containing protein [Staphylococcus aureus]
MTKGVRKHRKIDLNTRLAIAKYLYDGVSIADIARLLNRQYVVIWREVRRYTFDGVYDPVLAHEFASVAYNYTEEDREQLRKIDDEAKKYIEEKLSRQWSPRQIAKRIEKDIGIYISYPTIYRYIRAGLVKYEKQDLRRKGKKFNKSTEKRGKIEVGDRAIMYRSKFSK